MNRLFSGRSDMPFALLLLAPSLLLLGGLVAWPMVSNIEISFLRLPLNPNIESTFVGVSNYVRILSDPGFWHSLWIEWGSASLRQLEMCVQQSYDQLLAASTENWRQWWQKRRITVNGGDAHDQQALDYALYHLRIMTPAHDERSSIAAKGLTGEGYKGHVFWDTEVFLLPFHLFSEPTIARSLLRYRWHNLPGAQEKARRNGWQGALFPWESARSGEEETPEFAAINIRTGLRQKVASAQVEHHLVADIAWAVVQYWQTTGDESFIAHEGMALLLETAKFWISRTVRVNDRLEIHDVIGPDEYTEHVNNNAFTSYMAYYNVQQALNIARQFGCSDDAFIHRAEMFLKELWMPEIQPDGVLPQDDSFMAKPAINLAKYKAAAGKQTILLDYNYHLYIG